MATKIASTFLEGPSIIKENVSNVSSIARNLISSGVDWIPGRKGRESGPGGPVDQQS